MIGSPLNDHFSTIGQSLKPEPASCAFRKIGECKLLRTATNWQRSDKMHSCPVVRLALCWQFPEGEKRHIHLIRRTPIRGPHRHDCSMSSPHARCKISSAARIPITIAGAFVFPETIRGMIEVSATRSPVTPRTRNSGSNTAASSEPMRAVPQM